MAHERLGEILIGAGLLDERGLHQALAEQQRWGGHLGRHLVALGLISEETLVRALSTQCKLPAVALDPARVDPRVGRLVPQTFCERNRLVCFGFDERRRSVDIAMADPSSIEVVEELSNITRCSVRRYFAAPSAIERTIARIFHRQNEASGEINLPPGLGQDRVSSAVPPSPPPTPPSLPRTPPPPPGIPPSPPPTSTPPVRPAPSDVVDEIPLPKPSHVHITLDLPTVQKLRHKESAEQRLNRVEEMLARDGKLLQLLLGTLVRKGLLTREEIERIFARL